MQSKGYRYEKGHVVSKETRLKMRTAALGRKWSEESRKKMSATRKGVPAHNKGKRWTEEQREKMRGGNNPNYGKSHSEEWKRKMSKLMLGRRRPDVSARCGEKSASWKGGVTPVNEKIRKSLEYKLWRKAVFERDSYKCVWGGKEHGTRLNADHIKPFFLFPELRFAIDNGRTLCVDCHRKTDTFGSRQAKQLGAIATGV